MKPARRSLIAAGVMMNVAAAFPAHATTLMMEFLLDGTSNSAFPVTPPSYGTVTVDDAGNVLTFTVALTSGVYFFHDTQNANHYAFTFNVAGSPITFGALPSGFTVASGGPFEAPNFTNNFAFDYAVACPDACAGGNPNGQISSLSFVVSRSGGLSISDLEYITSTNWPGQNIYFAADIYWAGTAGNVGAVLSAVPEPGTWAMLIAGFGLIGFELRRRATDRSRATCA